MAPNNFRKPGGIFKNLLRRNKEIHLDAEINEDPRDIVIPVMGATGVGKSTFINTVLGRNRMAVGYEMESCTVDITTAQVDTSPLLPQFPWLQNRRLLLVDTPGFDDTYKEDTEILERIARWLEQSYNDQVLGGVIYLHDVSIDRFTGTAKRNLIMFNRLCGQGALERVVLGATKSSRIPLQEASKRLNRLKEVHWKDMIDKHAQVFELKGDQSSALSFVIAVLERSGRPHQHPEQTQGIMSLAIQHELVDEKMIIPETEAGKELRYTLQQVLEHQKRFAELSGRAGEGDMEASADLLEANKQIEKLRKQLQELKVPLSRRLRALLGF